MLIVQLKKNCDTKVSKLEKKLADHSHDEYIATSEFNTLAADVFKARLVILIAHRFLC